LLAVRYASQGQRLGRKLVIEVCRDAAWHNVSAARAAIRVENIASQKTFESAGFTTDRKVHEFLLWTPGFSDGSDVCPKNVAFLPVDTLTYRGLWIEGLVSEGLTAKEQRAVVRAARSVVARESRLNAGAVVSKDATHLLPTDLRDQASVQGEYYWFVKRMSRGTEIEKSLCINDSRAGTGQRRRDRRIARRDC
ncbi:MAG: hypothetical protein V3S14_04525, partial [Anaerolineae bacterium]